MIITECQTQKDMKRLVGARSVCLDAYGTDSSGKKYDLKDFYGEGKAIYPIERINLATGQFFEDGEHILYVNGEYRGESKLGKLMHDFNCANADDMNYDIMAERTRYLSGSFLSDSDAV